MSPDAAGRQFAYSPVVEITADMIDDLVSIGGYTHPLFHEGGDQRPLPGQGLLLLMGGLAEQSGVLDHAIAMVEIRRASFHRLVTAGDQVKVRLERGSRRSTTSGKALEDWTWTAQSQDGDDLATAEVLMLAHPRDTETP